MYSYLFGEKTTRKDREKHKLHSESTTFLFLCLFDAPSSLHFFYFGLLCHNLMETLINDVERTVKLLICHTYHLQWISVKREKTNLFCHCRQITCFSPSFLFLVFFIHKYFLKCSDLYKLLLLPKSILNCHLNFAFTF